MLCVHNLLSAPQYVSGLQLHPKLGSKPPWCLGRVHGAQLTESLSNTATNTSIRHGDTRPPRHQIATGHARRTLEPRHPNIHMHQSIKTPKLQSIEKELLHEDKIFHSFRARTEEVKNLTLNEINMDIKEGRTVCAYGASAKAFTMFALLGLNSSKIKFCADTSITKVGKIFPVFNIPVISEEEMISMEYDTVLVTAWNYKEEILAKSTKLFKRNTKLIFPLPDFEILYT